jgi:hypothetical protein
MGTVQEGYEISVDFKRGFVRDHRLNIVVTAVRPKTSLASISISSLNCLHVLGRLVVSPDGGVLQQRLIAGTVYGLHHTRY